MKRVFNIVDIGCSEDCSLDKARLRQRGMTLLELSIVLVILAVLTIFSVPNMRGLYERNKLVTSSRELVSLIRYARAEAITNERETEIRIDVKKDRYRLDLNRYKYAEVRGSGDRRSRKPEQVEHIRHLPRFVNFKEVATSIDPEAREKIAKIVFFPNGSATWTTIVLENRPPGKEARVRHMVIEVSHATGLPEVYRMTEQELKDWKSEQTSGEESEEESEEESTGFQVFFEDFEE